jgi:tryptophanyl-tRNA synthetase
MAGMPTTLRALSLAQPTTDSLHLGNYLGALRQWVRLQDDHEAFFGIADLHALTIEQDPATLTQQTLVGAAQFLAAGVDPAKSTLFVQSHVPEHAQLAWILGCITGFGQANRMTQFKDKVTRFGAESASVGLFTYPVLMAADILIYQAQHVPVGEDQRQHLELTRDLAVRFNSRYGETFTVPEPYILTSVGKIQDLAEPTAKMSKSALSAAGVIKLLDDPKITSRKIKSAVTDSGREIIFDEINKPGVSNLLTILSALTGNEVAALVEQFRGHGYGELKAAVADEVIAFVTPFRERTLQLLDERTELESILAAGADHAREVAGRTLTDVYRKVGLLPGRSRSATGGRADSASVGVPGRAEADERYVRT